MPRDSAATRARLLTAAEQLFATRGIFRTTLREITDAAGQRNASAVSYHFGSRNGLLEAVLIQGGTPLDHQRGHLLEAVDGVPSTRDLVGVLVTPLIGCLDEQSGRYYLRIVAQLTGRFAQWRTDGPLTGVNLLRVLAELEARAGGDTAAARGERLVAMMMLLTSVMAERSRLLDAGGTMALEPSAFEGNLSDMVVALLEAPASAPHSVRSGQLLA